MNGLLERRRLDELLETLQGPTFMSVNGYVLFSLGGTRRTLRQGDAVQWNKHGRFVVEYIGESHGIIRNTTINGKEVVMFIPSERWLVASNGRFTSFRPNYETFRAGYSAEKLSTMLYTA